jgi:hypothetical protein
MSTVVRLLPLSGFLYTRRSFNIDTQTFDNLDFSDDDDFADGYQPMESEHSRSRSKLVIVTSNGIFRCSVWWCHCAINSKHYVQLLRCAKLFPASFKNPKTAFTFEVLDRFRMDTLECKTAAMNFMSKLWWITDTTFPSHVPVCGTISQIMVLIISCCAGPILRITSGVKGVARSTQSY